MQIILSTLFPANKIGAIIVFIVAVGTGELGKKLDKGYYCPLYCEVKHEHIYEEKEINLQRTRELPRSVEPDDRQQSESDLRPIASTD